jgi:hypothetical protein
LILAGPTQKQRDIIAKRLSDALNKEGGWSAIERMPREKISIWIEDHLRATKQHPTQVAATGTQRYILCKNGMAANDAALMTMEEVGWCPRPK